MVAERIIDNAVHCADWMVETHAKHGREALRNEAERRGFNWLGGGCYSSVYEHPCAPGLVIKLTMDREDEASITYLAWARANPGPHVPKVYHLRREKKTQVAVINKLMPLDSRNRALYYEHLERVYSAESYREAADSVPMAYVAADIYEFFENLCGWDLHSGNIMQDENGCMVITDPVTTAYDKDSRTLLTGVERAFNVKAA